MAKKTVASLQKKGAKAFSKAVKMVKNEKTGGYSFKSEIVPKDKSQRFFCKIIVKKYLSRSFFLYLKGAFFYKTIIFSMGFFNKIKNFLNKKEDENPNEVVEKQKN